MEGRAPIAEEIGLDKVIEGGETTSGEEAAMLTEEIGPDEDPGETGEENGGPGVTLEGDTPGGEPTGPVVGEPVTPGPSVPFNTVMSVSQMISEVIFCVITSTSESFSVTTVVIEVAGEAIVVVVRPWVATPMTRTLKSAKVRIFEGAPRF